MELVCEDEEIVFFPSFEQLEELILFVVQHIASTLQTVSLSYANFLCND